jgi:hypothetical protein
MAQAKFITSEIAFQSPVSTGHFSANCEAVPSQNLFMKSVLDSAFENLFGEIALGGIGDQGYYSLACS